MMEDALGCAEADVSVERALRGAYDKFMKSSK